MKLITNFLSLAGAEFLSKLLTFAAFAYVARILGPASFGYVEFAGAALMCASLIVDQGFSAFGAREIAKRPEQTKSLAGEVVALRFILAALGYLAIVFIALLVDRGFVLTRLLLIYGLSLWGLPIFLQWVFQGHDQMRFVAVAQIVRQVVFAATVFAFLHRPEQLMVVAWAEVLATTITAILCLVFYRRRFGALKLRKPEIAGRLFREGVPIGLSQMFWVARMFGGTIAIGLIASAQEVAFFAGAQRILLALHTFVWLYFFNLLPSMSRAWEEGANEFNRWIQRSLKLTLWIAIAGALTWSLLAQQTMEFVYGREFSAAGTVLALFGFVCAMALVDGNYRYGLIAAGRQNAELMTSAIGAVFALILIPLGYFKAGLNGAAAGLVIAELAIWLSSALLAQRFLNLRGSARNVVVPLGGGILAFTIMKWLPLESPNLRFSMAMLLLAGLWLASHRSSRRLPATSMLSQPDKNPLGITRASLTKNI